MAAKELGLKFLKALIIEGAAYFTWKGVKNKIEGKTLFGKEQKGQEIRVDWKGNVRLRDDDWSVT